MITTWDLDPIMLTVGPLSVHWYGFFYIVDFYIFYYWGKKFIAPKLGIKEKTFEDFVFWGFVSGVLGGRIGYWLFYHFDWLWTDFWQIFKIWEGGMSIHGGLIGAVGFIAWWCWKHKVNVLKMTDALTFPLALSLALGRVGNFINGELYGRPTDQSWGVVFPHVDELLRHPSQLYEVGKNLLIFGILWTITKTITPQNGLLTGVFILGYGILRFIIEFFREPNFFVFQNILPIQVSMGQMLCVLMIFVGSYLIGMSCRQKNS